MKLGQTVQTPSPISMAKRNLLSVDLLAFDQELDRALDPQRPFLSEVELNIYQQGKRARPVMLMLSAKCYSQDNTPLSTKVVKAAVSLEMLHVATLVHDDIIDDALVRRGLPSVNAARGTNSAILVGDLQFVQAIRCFLDAIETDQEMGLAKVVLDTAFSICCGELDEINSTVSLDTAQMTAHYMDVIERKTAIMFGLACETGAALAGASSSDTRRMGFYGRRVGRAFQIMDDILDLVGQPDVTGKEKGRDLMQRRPTLPLIYAMEELGPEHLLSQIMTGQECTNEALHTCLSALQGTAAIERSYAEARGQALEAVQQLEQVPDCPAKELLTETALYAVDRRH